MFSIGFLGIASLLGGAAPFVGNAKLAVKCAGVVMRGANKQRESEMLALREELRRIEREERALGLR